MRKFSRIVTAWLVLVAGCSSDAPDLASSISLPEPDWHSAGDLRSRTTLDESSVCTTCVELDSVSVLGGELDGPRAIDVGTGYVAVDGRGRFWLGQIESILVVAPSGEVISRVGRRGEGPLEFTAPRPAFSDNAGNVFVYDPGNSRVSVIDPGFSLVRDFPAPNAIRDIARVSDSVFFTNGSSIGGTPFRVISNDTIVADFGTAPQTPEADMFAFGPVAAAADGTLYWSSQYEFEISVRDLDGSELTRFIQPGFNVPRVELGPFTEANPPPNRILDLRVDDDGFLWVLKWVRQDDWRSGMISSGRDGRLGFLNRDSGNAFDTEIDVIDPSRGAVVARLRTDLMLRGFAGETFAFANQSDELGIPSIRVVRLGLKTTDR